MDNLNIMYKLVLNKINVVYVLMIKNKNLLELHVGHNICLECFKQLVINK